MVQKRRLFIAIPLPLSIRSHIASSITKPIKKDIPILTFESEAKLHITLSFLGWTTMDPEIIAEKLSSIRHPEEDTTEKSRMKPCPEPDRINRASGKGSIPIEISTIDAFYGPRFVLYLNVKKNTRLEKLHKKINIAVESLGFDPDTRTFVPHVTLARSKKIQVNYQKKLVKDLKKKPYKYPAALRASELAIMQSRLTRKGSRYRVVKIIPFCYYT